MLYAYNEHIVVRRSGATPLYRNLMDGQTYLKQGFDISDINKIPESGHEGWYETNKLRVYKSVLPELPKRSKFSLKTYPAEEFTIIILVEFDNQAFSFLETNPTVIPGIHFAVIGENWEVFFNGTLVQSEIYIERDAQNKLKLKETRTWLNAYFPFDRNLIVPGTNIIAIRIIGDPSYPVTGLGFRMHHYIEDYKIIDRRQENFTLIALCCISGFIGIYYLILFFFIKNRREVYNLYFGIYSIILCIYSFTRHSIVNVLIPNTDISVRLLYPSSILMPPFFFLFIETLLRGKTSLTTRIYLYFFSFLAVGVIFFNNSIGEDITDYTIVICIIYGAYFLFYKLIYLYFRDKERLRDSSSKTHIIVAIVGTIGVLLSDLYETLEVLVFKNDISFFQYSMLAVYIGMAIYLAQNFGVMYKRLEATVVKRRQELKEQTAIAAELSAAKSRFLSTINNELKGPLSKIADDIQLAQEKAENDETKALMQKTWNDTMQMAQQVTGALEELSKTKSVQTIIKIGNLSFDLISNRAFFNGADLLLAPKEFALLYLFAQNEGKTLSAKHMYETVWNTRYSETANATLRAHMANLKKKLDDVTNDLFIETSRGEGYCLSRI